MYPTRAALSSPTGGSIEALKIKSGVILIGVRKEWISGLPVPAWASRSLSNYLLWNSCDQHLLFLSSPKATFIWLIHSDFAFFGGGVLMSGIIHAILKDHSHPEWYPPPPGAIWSESCSGILCCSPGILLCPRGFWFLGRHFLFFPSQKNKAASNCKASCWRLFITCCVMITDLSSDQPARSLVPHHNSVSFDLTLWFFASSSFLSLSMSSRPRHKHFVYPDQLLFLPFACLPHLNGSLVDSIFNIQRSYYSFKWSFLFMWSLLCVKAQNISPDVLATSIFLANVSRDSVFFLISRGLELAHNAIPAQSPS